MKINEKGQSIIISLIILSVVILTTVLIITGALTFFTDSSHSVDNTVALNIAEAGIDKAVASLNATAGAYNGESETLFGAGSFSVQITSKDASTITIRSTGYIPNKSNYRLKRTVQIQVSKGTGISFTYGMLVGTGGITMGNGSGINGSVYSNGSISGGNNETFTGDVYIAGGTQPDADQQTDCTDPNCTDYIFGTTVSGESRLNVAQSFKPVSSGVLNKVSLKLKKFGTPANPTVKILANNSGMPDKNQVLASGTLSANLVTNQPAEPYSFVDVTFSTSPNLTAGTTYWIMIVPQSLDISNYWSWSRDALQSYTNGSASWSANWQAKNPVWTGIVGDLGFKTWMGGVATSLTMSNGSVVQGSVHANTISGVTINKDAYYQSISNTIVKGTSNPGSSDPAPVAMPISQANISEWENDAQNYGVRTGDVTGCPATLGPGKIVGNILTDQNCSVIVKTPIWVTGNVTFGNATIFKMDSSLGAASGVIIVDGKTVFQNSNNLLGTGVSGSYLTLLSNYNTKTSGGLAIDSGNSSITGILYAPFGTIQLANNANFKEIVADQIIMGTGTILTYDSGLISTFFSAGPGGTYAFVKGSYK